MQCSIDGRGGKQLGDEVQRAFVANVGENILSEGEGLALALAFLFSIPP